MIEKRIDNSTHIAIGLVLLKLMEWCDKSHTQDFEIGDVVDVTPSCVLAAARLGLADPPRAIRSEFAGVEISCHKVHLGLHAGYHAYFVCQLRLTSQTFQNGS